ERIYVRLLAETPSAEVYRGLFALYKEEGAHGADRALRQLDDAITAASDKDDRPGDSVAANNARAMLQALRDDAQLGARILDAAHRALLGGQVLGYQTRTLLAVLASRTRQLATAEELYRSCLARGAMPRSLEQEIYGGLLNVLMQARKYDTVLHICEQGL